MASSNRHWPSMFKSKPCNNQQWSQHHDTNNNNNNHSSLNSCSRSSGGEERSPEPKPRWNPKPEQIRILETIFNSGMVNPPRDEIRRIRAQLQEYGQVGDANVFYWFQNRKSRSKNKQRGLQAKAATKSATATTTATASATSSTSSSSDKISSSNNNNYNILGCENNYSLTNTTTNNNTCNNYFQPLVTPHHHLHQQYGIPEVISQEEPIYFPSQQGGASVLGNSFSQGLCFSNNTHHDPMISGSDSIHVMASSNPTSGGLSSLLLGDMFNGGGGGGGGEDDQLKRDEVEKFKLQQELSFLVSTQNTSTCTISLTPSIVSTPTSSAFSGSIGHILGEGEAGKLTVFINGVEIAVQSGSFNVKEEFGEDVMLVNSSTGQPVGTDEWGVTLNNSLQNGASYYLVGLNQHAVASPLLNNKLHTTHHLIASQFPYQI